MWKVTSAGAILYLLHPLTDTDIQLHFQPSDLTLSLIQATPSLHKGRFIPTPWLANGQLQALFAAIVDHSKSEKEVSYLRELVPLSDGGTISIDWAIPQPRADNQKILILFHGLTGGSETLYIRNCVEEAQSRGYRVGVMHMRGVNNTPMTTSKPTSAGASEDVREGLERVKKQYPKADIVGVGCSMGAGLMLKYAGESREKCLLKAVVAVSCPFDLLVCSVYLRSLLFKLSDGYIAENLRRLLKANLEACRPLQISHNVDLEKAVNAKTLLEFDETFTRRALGFHSVEQYYRSSSCSSLLPQIQIPVLALSSKDDPVITYPLNSPNCIPIQTFETSPNLILAMTKTGGHVGWFTGLLKPRRWYPLPAIEFLDAVLAEER